MKNQGPTSMLKDGSAMVDEPVLKNIHACKEMSKITASSMGPYGLNKMVINHLGKIFVTHDAGTILNELEVEHPAAKLLVMTAKAMQEEVGDGTNFTVTLGGEFLYHAESLIRMGLHASDIIEGYNKAGKKALEICETLSHARVLDVKRVADVFPAIKTAVASKMYGYEDFLGTLVAEACVNACPANPKSFNVDNIRVIKLDGEGVTSSALVRGFVIHRTVDSTVKYLKNAKMAIYSCSVDVPQTEGKGTALMENAEQLLAYSKNEEDVMQQVIESIAKTGCNCIISNSNFGDLALHFIERSGMMAMKCPSKFELRRLSAAVGANVLARLEPPTKEDLGHCDNVDQKYLGGKTICVFAQDHDDSKLSTIVVRGATQNVMDDVERAIDDGVNTFKVLTKDSRLCAGAGAVEMELQKELTSYAETISGLDQYAVRKYASSFEVVPRTLATVAGFNGTDVVTELECEHNTGKKSAGVNIEDGGFLDAVETGIVDSLALKIWGIRLATDVAVTVLRVDQIIVAKQAGGPKPRNDQARDEE